MKFRTDFVTNSSDSSFLAFNILNIKLLRYLEEIGFTFELSEEGRFTENMIVTIPSGKTAKIHRENFWPPVLDRDTESYSAWLVAMILSGMDARNGFGEEAWALVEKAGIIDEEQSRILAEIDDREEYSGKLAELLQNKLVELDEGITEAEYQYAFTFESEAGPYVYDRLEDGVRKIYFYDDVSFGGVFPEDDEEFDISDVYVLPFEGGMKELMDKTLYKPFIQRWDATERAWMPPSPFDSWEWEYELKDEEED